MAKLWRKGEVQYLAAAVGVAGPGKYLGLEGVRAKDTCRRPTSGSTGGMQRREMYTLVQSRQSTGITLRGRG